MKQIRQLHLYLGTFFAPAILFFAFTGALQTFGLHEAARGSNSTPPVWIARLAQVHKNQTVAEHRDGPPPAANPADAQPADATRMSQARSQPRRENSDAAQSQAPSPLPLKIFVLFMSIGLIATTLLGLYMSFKYSRDKRVVWVLLGMGIVLPFVLLFL